MKTQVEAEVATAGTSLRASDQVLAVLRRFWGFESLRPLQLEAIAAGLERRDSLVVMPTGGGKSLCYQVPPAVAGRTDVVVSPLIALMKDQVDALRLSGYPAAVIHAWPLVGLTRVVRIPTVVDFPAPFGPRRPKISPGEISRESPSRATISGFGCLLLLPRAALNAKLPPATSGGGEL